MSRRMEGSNKLLVNTIALTAPLTGIGRYALDISRRLLKEEDLDLSFFYGYFSRKLVDGKSKDALFNAMTGSRKRLASFPAVKKLGRTGLTLLAALDRSRYDIYWEPNIVPLPQLMKKTDRTIVTIHDFSWYHHPEWHPKERISFFKDNFYKGIEKCEHFITGSKYTQREITGILGIPENKITVISHGVDHERFKIYPEQQCREFAIRTGLPEKFVLFVGTLEPRKNLERLLKAYDALPESLKKEYKLVIAGGKGWNDENLRRILSGMEEVVLLTGYVPENELPLLYNLASVFVYPSLYEGFGIPPLEAMACGCPVVVSDATAMPEVCGNAALYCDPGDLESIGEKLVEILEDGEIAEVLKVRGIKNAKKFSWDISAAEHLKVFSG